MNQQKIFHPPTLENLENVENSNKKIFPKNIYDIISKVGKATFIALTLKVSALENSPRDLQFLTKTYSVKKINKKDEQNEELNEIERYKKFCDEVAIISDNKNFANFFKALIEQESRWLPNVRSYSGAIWLAQLTSTVIRDMGPNFRSKIYIERLVFLKNQNPKIFDNFPSDLKSEIFDMQKNNFSNWVKIVDLFKKYKHTNPEVNLLLGALVLDIILDFNTTTSGSEKFYKNFLSKMNNSGIDSVKIDNIYPDTSSEKQLTQAVYMYNNNSSKIVFDDKKYHKNSNSKITLEEREIHTIAVLENYQKFAKKSKNSFANYSIKSKK